MTSTATPSPPAASVADVFFEHLAAGDFVQLAAVFEPNADPGPTGRIQSMSMLCSGFVREHSDG